MDGVAIRCGGEQARLPLAALPLVLCGVGGFLLLFQALDGVSFRLGPPLLTAAVLLGLLWAGQRFGGRWFFPALLAGTIGLCIWVSRHGLGTAGSQAGSLLGYWFGDRFPVLELWFGDAPPPDATALAAGLGAGLTAALFTVEYLFRDHEIAYTAATALLVYVPLLGLRADSLAVFLLALFRLALRSAQNAAARDGQSLLPAPRRTDLAAQSTALVCLLLSLAFLGADTLVRDHEDTLYDPAYRMEGALVRAVRSIQNQIEGRGTAESGGSGLDGQIGGGNQYQSNVNTLELTASACPTLPLYLRSFVGGDYVGGAWEAAEDKAIFQAIQPELMPEDPASWAGSAPGWFNGMYYEMNQELHTRGVSRYLYGVPAADGTAGGTADAAGEGGGVPLRPSRILRLRNLSRRDDSTYTPYYSYPMPARVTRPDGTPASIFPEETYGFLYFQQDELRIDWDLLSEVNHGMAVWYKAFQDAYLREARRAYTQVPEDLVPRLAELVRENPLTDLDEITAFILHSLHSRATYTLTPGRPPANRDVVEDFLFEKGQGYCQHFAAAAALMYRLYGVPARYAAGYVALPSAFAPVYEDGGTGGTASGSGTAEPGALYGGEPVEWRAEITDRSAHAWVEIFLDGCGWTPVEVTPASADSAAGTQAAASYPGFDQEVQADIAREHGWTGPSTGADSPEDGGTDSPAGIDSPDSPVTPENPEDPQAPRTDTPSPPPSTLRRDGGFRGYAAFLLFTVLLLIPPVLVRRRQRILDRLDRMDSREALYRLGELLRFAGTPVDETAEDYGAQVAAAVPALAASEAARLAETANRAAFGAAPPEEAENRFTRDLYRKAAQWLYGTLNRRRRIVFRWIAVLG